MPIFLDSNILLDLIDPTSRWREWARSALDVAATPLLINMVVFAEVSVRFASADIAERLLAEIDVAIVPIDLDAAYRAGKAHAAYRRAGGARSGVLADFLIGAHATTLRATLMTRDRQRFASYFPDLTLMTPDHLGETHHG